LLPLVLLLAFAPLSPAHAQRFGASDLVVPITGTFTDALGGVGQFTGTMTIQRFAEQGGNIVAVGVLVGTLTDSTGQVLGSVVRTVTMLLNGLVTQASCSILHLELGPLDLNLLGLVVHLNRVVLDITAVPGAGNLLGNLLCAIARLLDGGSISALVAALNGLLQLLL